MFTLTTEHKQERTGGIILSKKIEIYIKYIYDLIVIIRSYTERLTEEQFTASVHEQDALIRRLERKLLP